MMRKIFRVLAAAAFAASLPCAAQPADGKPQSLPISKIQVGTYPVSAEVAQTPDQRALGLMYRFSLKPDHGMVFVFDRSEPRAFWMKNTFIPLSIAFVAADGRILNIDDMAPQDERTHLSSGPAMYAIEMRKGWFAERGIKAGDRVAGLPSPKP